MAPTPTLHGTLVGTPSGTAGTFATIRAMRALVRQAKTDLRIRQTAANLVFMTPEKDGLSEVNAIYSWVRDHIRYMQDVNDVETLATPWQTIAMGYGDCDDQATLTAALLESIGYPTRFVMAGYTQPGSFEHVYLQTYAAGQWIDLDPTENFGMGVAAPGALTTWVEK